VKSVFTALFIVMTLSCGVKGPPLPTIDKNEEEKIISTKGAPVQEEVKKKRNENMSRQR